MSPSDAALLCQTLEDNGIAVWIDGGWGVDALLGIQTRAHADADIVIPEKDVARVRMILESMGFADAPQDDTRSWNFVLAGANGRKVDVHVIVLDREGNGIYGPPENGQIYPASALSGEGLIGGRPVKCMSPEYQIANHTGYEPRQCDYHDVRVLAERFRLPVPKEYGGTPNGE